ncbi:MAG: SPOR domain-containing protein [Methyloceanibacter sp.]|uniref:SPOR domain-containing protein n=1 Tax=Methyloceanibacter sp. TaxID=1965321 RepID=UPI003D6D4D7B
MRRVPLASFVLMLALLPALAETPTEAEGPLSPCVPGSPGAEGSSASGPQWGVEIASSFDKQEALDEFAQAQKQYSDILGDYSPMVIEVCDLSMGTDLRYAVRIGLDSRDAADALCNKLQAAGGACIVLKN